MQTDRIVTLGLPLQREFTLLGPTFDCAWPVERAPGFRVLLRAIDDADRELRSDSDKPH